MHMNKTKRLKYQRLIKNYKDKKQITTIENKLVVAYKDRLTRFGFDLIEDLIKKYSNGVVILDDEKDAKKEPKEELVDDVLQILNVYTAKMNGLIKKI